MLQFIHHHGRPENQSVAQFLSIITDILSINSRPVEQGSVHVEPEEPTLEEAEETN
jgi:hypothetical protein